MSLSPIVIQRGQYGNLCLDHWFREAFFSPKQFPSACYMFVPSFYYLKPCCKFLSFSILHLYNANGTKYLRLKLMGTLTLILRRVLMQKWHVALTVIHACIMYIKRYSGDDCTLLDCVIVMQQSSQMGAQGLLLQWLSCQTCLVEVSI